MKKLIVLAVVLFSVFICSVNGKTDCENDSSQYCVIIRGIESFGNIAEKYQKGLDNRVPFPQLSTAIKQIDEHMGDYQGTAKNNMDTLRSLNNGLEDTYHECVSPVYNWCLSGDLTFKLYITHISNEKLADRTKKLLIDMLTKKILEGHVKMTSSLSILKKVIQDTTSIKNVLGKIHFELKQDFSPEGYYGKKKQELENAKGRRQRRALIIGFLAKLDFLVNAAKAVLALVNQISGIALGLAKALFGAGISSRIVEGKQEPTFDENIKIIETLYNVLDTKIREAQRYAEEAHTALIEDSNNLNALNGLIIAANDTLPLHDTALEIEIVGALENVRAQCTTYTNWHKDPNHSNVNSRHRRDTGNVKLIVQEPKDHSSLNQKKMAMAFKKRQQHVLNLLYDNAMFAKFSKINDMSIF